MTTVALDVAAHQRLMIAAVEDRLAMTEVVRQAVQAWLDVRARRRTASPAPR